MTSIVFSKSNEGALGRYMNGVLLPALLTSHYVQKLTNHYTGDWFLIQCTKKGDVR